MSKDNKGLGAPSGTGSREPSPDGLGPSGFDPSRVEREALAIIRRIVATTHSHVDGRDHLAELHPRKTLDIKRRADGVETWFEGDWLSTLNDAVKAAKAFLYSREIAEQKAAEVAAYARQRSTAEAATPMQRRDSDGNPEGGNARSCAHENQKAHGYCEYRLYERASEIVRNDPEQFKNVSGAYQVVAEMLEHFDSYRLATWAPLVAIIERERQRCPTRNAGDAQ